MDGHLAEERHLQEKGTVVSDTVNVLLTFTTILTLTTVSPLARVGVGMLAMLVEEVGFRHAVLAREGRVASKKERSEV